MNPNWAEVLTAWSTLAYVVLTALLAGAATLAAWFAFRQMKSVDAQLVEARKTRLDSARPFLVVDKVTLLPVDPTLPDRMVELRIKNVGKGVAIEVAADAWVARVPPGLVPAQALRWEPFLANAEKQFFEPPEPPSASAKVMAIADGDSQVTHLLKDNSAAISEAASGESALVFVALTCNDIFRRKHSFPTIGGTSRSGLTWRVAQFEDRPPIRP